MSIRLPIVRFIAKRVVFGLATLLVISVLIFGVTQALPSDPATIMLGRDATPEAVATLRHEFGMDRSIPGQYAYWLKGVATGDLGTSFSTRLPLSEYIAPRVLNSLFLLLCAGVVSIPISLAIGAYAALKRDKTFDNASSLVLLVLAAMPEFVVGTLLVILLATFVFKVLPATTYLSPDQAPWADMKGLVLPILTLVCSVTPYVARVMRASMVEVLESDYVEMARLKGMPERTVLMRHALPNAVGPVFQVIALNLAYLAGGVIIVERLFNFPGIGSALGEAVRARDLPVVQFLALVIAAVYVLTNMLADVGTVLVTPRLRTKLR
jgi:peptide/nickel transport system permease protein